MSTRQNRKSLSSLNDNLRLDSLNLKSSHNEMLNHIQTLIRRQKQLSKLKQQLMDQLQRSQKNALRERSLKHQKCVILQGQISNLSGQVSVIQTNLLSLQQQYQLCLNDYDKILSQVTLLIQQNKVIELELNQQKQKQSTIKAMIFDFQRLQRVLEEEKKYFRQLSHTEHKSHADRMKQFQQIRRKLINQEQSTTSKLKNDRLKIAFIRLIQFNNTKIKQYAEIFFRGNYKFQKTTDLGINKLRNCLITGTMKVQKAFRGIFFKWHNNAFPKNVLNNIVQNALTLNIQSRTKIVALNKIVQKLNSDNLSLLHLYERTKIIVSTSNSLKHKQKYMAFSLWRDIASVLSKRKYFLQRMANKTLVKIQTRQAFNQLRNRTHLIKRFQVATHLLQKFQQTRELARMLRTWRLQIHNRQHQIVKRYIQQMTLRRKIQTRVKYQKRKIKAITILQLSMARNDLRNGFFRYYQNVKKGNIQKTISTIEQTKTSLATARKQNKAVKTHFTQKHKTDSISILSSFNIRRMMNPYFKIWKNNSYKLTQRNTKIWHLVLRKQCKQKCIIMNQFRKVIQYHQKKQMHQVLTDLNNKMSDINERSTAFRQSLQKIKQSLAIESSKKLYQVSSYTVNCQKRVFFDWHSRLNIKRKYKEMLVSRMFTVFQNKIYNDTIKAIKKHGQQLEKDKLLQAKQNKFMKLKQQRVIKKTFFGILNQLKLHKKIFAKFIHAQNVMYFYRLEYAMINIMKKAHIQTKNSQQKQIGQLNQHLTSKSSTLKSLKTDKSNLDEKLKIIYHNAIKFEQLSLRAKIKRQKANQLSKYFKIYRQKVQNKVYSEKILSNLMSLIQNKNYFIFWKSLLVISSQTQQQQIKQELAKINKKKKTFDQKNSKAKIDLIRKMNEQTRQYQQKVVSRTYYQEKYTGILAYYDKSHIQLQNQRYMRSIFYIWKREYLGIKKLTQTLSVSIQRQQIIKPYRKIFDQFRKFDFQDRSRNLCQKLLQKKCQQMIIDGFNYWRYNMRHGRCEQITDKILNIDNYYQKIRQGILEQAELYGNQKIRNRYYNMKQQAFMAFKNQWITRKRTQNSKITPAQQLNKKNRLIVSFRHWSWLAYYKKTKRSYLSSIKQKQQISLKKDVFDSLKIYRQQIYRFVGLADLFVQNRSYFYLRFAMSKIINVASLQKNQLIYQRRRQLHTLLMNKVTREKQIKRRLMWKWQSNLIQRRKYLPNVLLSIRTNLLKSCFYMINKHKYWNQFYTKSIADKVSSQGYTDVNTATNLLIKQGYDPDQLKDYLKGRNQQDNNTRTRVLGHLRTYQHKKNLLKAFHSWQQFVQAKRYAKYALAKVMNFSTGMGRYFNKWRKKDPQFNQILQKQSRVNMLQRYKQLARLMKQYRRDIKDSLQNCDQLKIINDQYAKSTSITIQMGLSNLSSSVKKGMKQALDIWKVKSNQIQNQKINQRYDQIIDGIQLLDSQKRKVKQRINAIEYQNRQLRQKCKMGQQCGQLLKMLMSQKDVLTIDLAEKQHNLKILLEDNLRLKQKIKVAKDSALKLIAKVKYQGQME